MACQLTSMALYTSLLSRESPPLPPSPPPCVMVSSLLSGWPLDNMAPLVCRNVTCSHGDGDPDSVQRLGRLHASRRQAAPLWITHPSRYVQSPTSVCRVQNEAYCTSQNWHLSPLPPGVVISVVLFFTLKTNRPPHWIMQAVLGTTAFVMSIAWLNIEANETVATLQTFGLLFNIDTGT